LGNIYWTSFIVLCALYKSVCAIDIMGPPAATHEPGEWMVGFDYSYSEEDLQITDGETIDLRVIRDARKDRYYATVGLAILKYWELYIRGGYANGEWGQLDFNSGLHFTWSFGTRISFFPREQIDWGVLFQMSMLELEETGYIEELDSSARQEVSVEIIQIALGPRIQMDGWFLYGGPFFYKFDGDVKVTEIKAGGFEINPDLEEESMYGAYVGSVFDLDYMGDLMIEYAYTGKGWAIGASLSWKF
jgi:hypothetical protein